MKKKKEKIEQDGLVTSLLKKLTKPVSDKLYDVSVAIHKRLPHKQKTGKQKRIGEAIFYWAISKLFYFWLMRNRIQISF